VRTQIPAAALTALSLAPVVIGGAYLSLEREHAAQPHADRPLIDVTAGLSISHATAFLPPPR
jgi:hypothetical protein